MAELTPQLLERFLTWARTTLPAITDTGRSDMDSNTDELDLEVER